MKKRHLIGKMTMEIYDLEDNLLTEIPLVTRKGINQVYWIPVQNPPSPPASDAIPFQMQIALMGGGMEYPAGDYKVKVTRNDQVYEKTITVYNNPDLPYSEEDRELKREYQKIGFGLMEDLAYADRQINDVLNGLQNLENLPGISNSTLQYADELRSGLEDVRNRMMVTQYGDLRGEAKLREEVGFLNGIIAFYGGRPTQVQMDHMALLKKRVNSLVNEVDELLKILEKINKGIEKAGGKTITVISRED